MDSRSAAIGRAAAVGGVVVAVAIGTAVAGGQFGRGQMMVPLVLGLLVVAAVVGVETMVRPPTGPRTASLAPRRVLDYVPRRLAAVVGTLLVVLVATMLLTTLTAAEDASLGGERVIACFNGVVGSATGPYAGSYYTGRLTLVLVAMLAVVALAARQVVLRPRGVVSPGEDDDALRRHSMTALVLALGAAVGATQAGIALFSAGAMLRLDTCAPAWTTPVGWLLVASAVLSAGTGLVCFAGLLVPAAVRLGPR